MVDSASYMECKNCKVLFSVEEFWEHTISNIKCNFSLTSGIDLLKNELKEIKEKYTELKESSKETEVSLKTEIKYLLSKLTQTETDERALKLLSINQSNLSKPRTKSTVRLKRQENRNTSISRTIDRNTSSIENLNKRSMNTLRESINLPRMI